MTTQHTLTVTLADDNSLTEELAGQKGNEMAALIIEHFKGDADITAMTPTFASKAITIAVT